MLLATGSVVVAALLSSLHTGMVPTGRRRHRAGRVRGLLPGVSVEAASPALIEKVRTVVTDGPVVPPIVDLRPGPYTVTFTLSGFSPSSARH